MERLLFAVTLTMALLLPACSKEQPKNEADASSISGYNYTNEGIQEFYVNGAWGGGVSIGGGYGHVCCAMLADKWTPGLSATVEWRRSDCGAGGPGNKRCPSFAHLKAGDKIPDWEMKTLKKVVPIEPFEESSTVQVMFLPNDEVKIYVTSKHPEHPEHPAKLGRPYPIDNPAWKDTE